MGVSRDAESVELVKKRNALQQRLLRLQGILDPDLSERLQAHLATQLPERSSAFYKALDEIDGMTTLHRSLVGEKRRLQDEIARLEFAINCHHLSVSDLERVLPAAEVLQPTTPSMGFMR